MHMLFVHLKSVEKFSLWRAIIQNEEEDDDDDFSMIIQKRKQNFREDCNGDQETQQKTNV